jgi:hypothetical protein
MVLQNIDTNNTLKYVLVSNTSLNAISFFFQSAPILQPVCSLLFQSQNYVANFSGIASHILLAVWLSRVKLVSDDNCLNGQSYENIL